MYGDSFTIQFYNASSLNFTATPRTVNFTTQVHYGNLLGSTISNPQIVASVDNGRLMIGIYQHDEAIANASATTWFLGEFTADATPVLLNSHQEQEMAYNIRYTNGQFRVQTAYNVSYYRTTINGFVLDRRNPCSELLQNQILQYSVGVTDVATNNSYYLFQEPDLSVIDKRRLVIYQLSYDDKLIQKKTIVPSIPLNYSKFHMDVAVKNSNIYIVFLTDQRLVYTPFNRDNRRNGYSEIVSVQLNMTDLSYLAYGGFSTANEDYIFKILNVGNTGSFSLLGITDGELARGWFPSDINRRLFVAQFGYLRITNIVTPPSPSNSPGLRIRSGVRFSVSFSHSITSLDLPIVYIRQSHKPFAPGSNIVSSTWNGTHLNVLPINDVGSSQYLRCYWRIASLQPD
ncbi:hypothetical protein BKA69DRAFT_704638 [Paraphysoderma sedebokerense]|nr:hypothetical protein BKA69DRAFT_704638 [Paraphysoderma sedebokerense]